MQRAKSLLLIFGLCVIIAGCPADKISINVNLIPPCASDSKNFKNPLDGISSISFIAVQENPNSEPQVISSASFSYESGGKGLFDIPLSKNVRIVVEGYDDSNKMILRGASQLFDVTVNSPTTINVPIFIAHSDAFSQTTDYASQECSQLLDEMQGATVTPLPNGDVLIAGGVKIEGGARYYSANLYLYNSSTGTFEEIPIDDTIKEYGTRAYHTATLYNKGTDDKPEWKVLIVGGETYINGKASSISTAEIYDVATKRVEFLSSMLEEGRMNHTATLMQNGKIVIIGGENKVDGKVEAYLDTVELFDIYDETFTKLSGKDYYHMAYGRSRHTATYLPLKYNTSEGKPVPGFDKIFVAGGIRKTGNSLYINDEIEVFGCANTSCTDYRFDIVRKNDKTSLKMIQKRYGHQAVPVMIGTEPISGSDDEFRNFYVIFIGGYTCIGMDRCAGTTLSTDCTCPNNNVFGSITKSIEVFEPTNSQGPQIKYNTEMQTPRADFGAVYISRDTNNLLIFGGYNSNGAVIDLVEAMTVLNNKVTMPAPFSSKLLFPRADFSFGVMPDGSVFIAGGDNGKKGSLSTAEIFVPSLPSLLSE